MDNMMTAVEVGGLIDEQQRLQLDEPVSITGPRRVRVIILYSEDEEWSESAWLQAAARNPAFEFLKDAAEDIYSVTDGVPFRDEI